MVKSVILVGETEVSIGLLPSEDGAKFCNILVNVAKHNAGFKFELGSIEKSDVKSLISFLTHYLTKSHDTSGIYNANRVTFYFYEDCVELNIDVTPEDVEVINKTWSVKVIEDDKWVVKLNDENIANVRSMLMKEYNRFFNVE